MKYVCENCDNRIPAVNEKVVGCRLLNRLNLTDAKRVDISEVKGNVYEGWFGKGSGMLYNGIVVDKKATCRYHSKIYEPEIPTPFIDKGSEYCPCCQRRL